MRQTAGSSEPPDCVSVLSAAVDVSAAAGGPSAGPGSWE